MWIVSIELYIEKFVEPRGKRQKDVIWGIYPLGTPHATSKSILDSTILQRRTLCFHLGLLTILSLLTNKIPFSSFHWPVARLRLIRIDRSLTWQFHREMSPRRVIIDLLIACPDLFRFITSLYMTQTLWHLLQFFVVRSATWYQSQQREIIITIWPGPGVMQTESNTAGKPW